LRGVTPEKLRQVAADLEAKAEEAFRAGKAAEGEAFLDAAWSARDKADQRERQLAGRPARSRSDNLPSMLPAARVRISKGTTRVEKPDELRIVANEAGHTVRSLADEVGCSNVFLLRARRGDAAIRESWAKEVQRLTRSAKYPTGFAATRRNWPGGWAREPGEK
jgi:hypothetical protein